MTQTVLNLRRIEKPATTIHEHHTKRRSETTVSKPIIKKQKQQHDKEASTENSTVSLIETTKDVVDETAAVSTKAEITKQEDADKQTEAITTTTFAKDVEVAKTDSPAPVKEAPLLDTSTQHERKDEQEQLSAVDEFTPTFENTLTPQHIPEEDALSTQDTLSPPSSFIEPMTPPRPPQQAYTAPHKEYLTETDRQRIEYETSTLEKLRKSLDIVITDRAARNKPALYHQIESILRISTGRTITLSHICQIMHITPQLYTLEAKELRNYGGKVTEAFLIQFTKDWSMPLAGKDLQKRADILKSAITQYFKDHPEVRKCMLWFGYRTHVQCHLA